MSINCSFRIIIIYFCLYLSGLSVSAQVQVRNTIWNGEDFLCTPACRVVKEDSIRSLIFESVSYKGQAKSVFAYYATPAMLQGNSSQEKKLPGIILVHGGGGTAFREWVVMWAKRGYAALALDTRGNGPDKNTLMEALMKMKRRHLILMSLYLKRTVGISGCQRYFQCAFSTSELPGSRCGAYCHYWYKLGWGIDLHCSFIRFSVSGSRSCLRLWVSF